jgi:outer membrane protein insertion porin family
LFFTDLDGPAGPLPPRCDPLKAGRYLCDALGERLTSALGYSFVYDSLDSRQRPTRGQVVSLNQDVAGLGGDVHYLRTRASASKYFALGRGFVFSTSIEGGYIHSFDRPDDIGEDSVRLTDRFFLGEPQLRGFDIRGVGPRVQRIPTRWVDGDTVDEIVDDVGGNRDIIDDALGGRAYYLGRAELEIPLGSSLRELGLRPSVFADVGALFKLRDPILTVIEPGPVLNASGQRQCIPNSGTGPIVPIDNTPTSVCPAAHTLAVQTTGFREVFVGDTPKPRLSVGFGVNWNSPFGPFRIDVAKALIKADGDDTKLITFNVGTAF